LILAGDVGGTKILLEAGEIRSGAWTPALARRYESGDVSFAEALGQFLDEWAPAKGSKRIRSAAFGAAGPKSGNCVKMTNRPWSVDGDLVARRFGIPKAPRVVMGVGTGLGVAYLVDCGKGYVAVPGEGGHATFAPVTPVQVEMVHAVREGRGRVSNEDIVSGTGLSRIYEFMMARGDCGIPSPDAKRPDRISQAALDGSDAICGNALDLFVECIGNVAGDHALNVMAQGGVFLTGGIVAKIFPRLKSDTFRAAFCAKGVHSALLKRIPVKAVMFERLAVLGAAAFAR
jgi:glucokinase